MLEQLTADFPPQLFDSLAQASRGVPVGSALRFAGGLVAGLGLLAWIGICGGSFWLLYSRFSATSPESALAAMQGMLWPFTVIAIAVPLLLIIAFGGLRAIGRLVELQKMVAGFPKDIEAMQNAVEVFRNMKDELSRLSGQIITDINRASVETGQDEAKEREEAAAVKAAGKDPEYVAAFYRMYEKAKRYFYDALKKYNQAAAEPRLISRGESYALIAQTLLDKRQGLFDPGPRRDQWIGQWVVAVFETERNTRVNRATLLTDADVKRLSEQEPDAGA